MQPRTYILLAFVAVASSAGGYGYGSHSVNCEAVVIAQLQHSKEFSGKLAALTGGEDFLTTLTKGRK